MLFINPGTSSQGAKDYFRDQLTRSDYYAKDGQEIVGQWHGRGAALLGLSGAVGRENYFRLCDNQDPRTGKQLTARMRADRRSTYDFTWDCPKEVSLAYELGGDKRILGAFRNSVRETMAELENDMRVRVRKGGLSHDRVSANMVWCEFLHRTTRPLADGIPDPQLHIHAVAQNISFDPVENCWKAGEFGAIKRDAPYYQAAFHARLGKRLSEMGYIVEREGKSFRLVGFGKTLVQKFSRRTQVIEAEAEARHITDAAQKSKLGKLTRKGKGEELGVDALRPIWEARLTGDEKRKIKDACAATAQAPRIAAKAVVNHAVEHVFERESVVTDKRLLAEALMHGVGSVSVEDVHTEAKNADIIQKDQDGIRYVTTRQVHREEVQMMDFVRSGRGTCKKLGKSATLDDSLSREQRGAAEMILNSRDRVVGLRGGAGTGKTRLTKATVRAIEAGGKKVFTFAPSAEASRGVLRAEGFETADTVEKLLTDERLRADVAGQVIWIDEAGLLSVKDMNRLFTLASEQDCRVVLAGDSRQHASVARGDALRLIERNAGLQFAELKEIRRQTNDAYRAAVMAIAQGDAPANGGKTQLQVGIERLDAIGAITECAGEERFYRIAADCVATLGQRNADGSPKTALVVSPTHAEADKVTREIRNGLKANGRLSSAEHSVVVLSGLNWTAAQRKETVNYEPGMVVQFHQNSRGFRRGERLVIASRNGGSVKALRADGTPSTLPLSDAERFQVYRSGTLDIAKGDRVRITQNGYTKETRRTGRDAKSRLNNGATFEVAGFTSGGDIRLANGFVVPKDYGHLAHGYVTTSHASQGKSVDRVFIAMGYESLVAASRELFYVAVSRGKETVKLYTEDKRAMLDAVQASRARFSATELLGDVARKEAPKKTNRVRQLMEMNRIGHSYRAIVDRSQEIYRNLRRGVGHEQRT